MLYSIYSKEKWKQFLSITGWTGKFQNAFINVILKSRKKIMNELEVFIRINLIDVILNKKYKLQKNKCNISEVK